MTAKKNKMEDDLKHFFLKEDDLKKSKNLKMEDDPPKKWKTYQSTKFNPIGCDSIVNSPSNFYYTSHLMVISTFNLNNSVALMIHI
jgi:hypothetical protein